MCIGLCICSCSIMEFYTHAPNDMQIRRAKPEAKAYTLGDGKGCLYL